MKRLILYVLFGAAGIGILAAQVAPGGPGQLAGQDAEPNRPPDQSVARVRLINGDVSVRRGDSGDVIAAAVNAPLMVEDRLLTASAARAEIQFDSANFLRAGSNSEVRLNVLSPQHYQIQLAIGTVSFRVLRDSNAQVEIDTPIVGVRPLGRGTYRITVREDGSSDITVREGEAEIESSKGMERLQAGNTMLTRGLPSDPEFQIAAEIGPDELDRWSEQRDRELLASASYRHVSPDVYGAEDLDPYGRWESDPTYGQVWQPNVGPGWAPYQNGQWAWEGDYGWTWISYDPWGWAPFHYGRWFRGSSGWLWWPGPVYGRHYWSPALVGFFGFGSYAGAGFGFGNIGWVALAPYEPIHPWWGGAWRGGSFFGGASVVRNINVLNVYRNARVANGIVGVRAEDFGRHTVRPFGGINANSVRQAGLVRGSLPVAPTRASLQFSSRAVRASSFPQTRNSRFYGSRGSASAVARVPFEQQQRAVEQGLGRGGFGQSGALANRGGADPARGGWHRFGEPGVDRTGPRQPGGSQYSGGNAFRPEGGASGSPGAARGARAPEASRGFQGNTFRSFGEAAGGNPSGPVRISPPIVNQRPSGNYSPGARENGGYSNNRTYQRTAPNYGGSRPSAPSYRGGSAPRGGGGHSGGRGGGGGHHGR